jgi:YidC/Oxa1 family membrane protein insertase
MNETRNLVLAIVLSVAILAGWPFLHQALFPAPPAPPQTAQQQTGQQAGDVPDSAGEAGVPQVDEAGIPQVEGGEAVPADAAATREDAVAAAPRVTIDTPRLSGSINLRGARFDDLTLLGYREELDADSPLIDLLQPAGGLNAYFAQFGWSPAGELQVPTSDSVWQADGERLAPGSPVTLSWTNDAGVTFQQILTVDENYMFTVTQRIENGSGAAVAAAPYGRIYRAGTPDVLGFYILHEGLIGVFNGVLEERDYEDIIDEPGGREQFQTTGGWMGITDKYWLVALLPDQQTPVVSSFKHTGQAQDRYHVNYISDPVSVAPGSAAESTGRVFAGAKETVLLDEYEEQLGVTSFDLAVDFGWFYFLTKPIFLAIHWLNEIFGNFGVAILILTVGIKLVFFPLANKSYRAMSKMKLLQPKIIEMRERLGDDKQKMQQEMMDLYRKEKVNPLSGCLPILVQIPVFFALYKVLFVTIEMRHAPFFGWIQDLSAPDPLGIFTLFGLLDYQVPGILQIFNIGIWPILMGLTMYLQQKLNPPPADPIQAKIFGILPIVFTFILGTFPAGLVIYWTWNNFLSIVQQYIIMRRMGVAIGGGKADE